MGLKTTTSNNMMKETIQAVVSISKHDLEGETYRDIQEQLNYNLYVVKTGREAGDVAWLVEGELEDLLTSDLVKSNRLEIHKVWRKS